MSTIYKTDHRRLVDGMKILNRQNKFEALGEVVAAPAFPLVHGRHAIALRQRAVHPSQQVSEGEDGVLNVRLRLVICPEFIGFVLGMLPDIEVIAPQVLSAKLEDAVDQWKRRCGKAR